MLDIEKFRAKRNFRNTDKGLLPCTRMFKKALYPKFVKPKDEFPHLEGMPSKKK